MAKKIPLKTIRTEVSANQKNKIDKAEKILEIMTRKAPELGKNFSDDEDDDYL